jgi:hypothetical protein
MNVHLDMVKNAQYSTLLPTGSMNGAGIANRRPGGERVPKTAYFAYRTLCDTMRTQMPTWSHCSEFAKICNRPENCNCWCYWVFWCGKTC